MDPATLAAAAVTAVAGYLAKLGGAAAEESAKSAGKSVFDWVKSKLTGAAGKEAVEKFETAPEKAVVRNAFESQLALWLDENPAAAAELEKLLADAHGGSGGQAANVTGSNNKVGQADRGSSVNIS